MNPMGLIISGSLGLILDAIFVVIITNTLRNVAGERKWPSTPGTVLQSMLVWHRPGASSSPAQYPVVQYNYHVNGRLYQNDRVAAGMAVGGPGAHQVIERYPAGSQVNVFYNPLNPADSVLEIKTPISVIILWVFILAASVFLIGIPLVEYLTV